MAYNLSRLVRYRIRREVELLDQADGWFSLDHYAEDTGTINEDKVGSVGGVLAQQQSSDLLGFMKQVGRGSLDYNFVSPTTGKLGPTSGMAAPLLDAAMNYNVGFHIYDYEWWWAFQ